MEMIMIMNDIDVVSTQEVEDGEQLQQDQEEKSGNC
jgi:hypothetical protein